jgi:hypothetical protein
MALLVVLLAMLGVPFAMDALGMQVSSIAYDCQVQPSIAYDRHLLTAFDYDSGPVPVADENGNQITGRIRTVGAFVDIAEFLAAKAAPKGNFYSPAFETRLNLLSYPGVSRARHFQEVNENLLRAMALEC